MKSKTIKKIIADKFAEWVATIDNDHVKKLVQENTIVTGGCIASMLLKEKVNDFDVYFTNKETVLAVAKYYLLQWINTHPNDSDGIVVDGANFGEEENNFLGGVGANLTPDRVKIVFRSRGIVKEAGAIDANEDEDEFPDGKATVDEATLPKYRPIFISPNAITLSQHIQIVIRFYGDADTIHQHYDYVHCTNYWTSKDQKLTLKANAMEALLARELIYVGSKYPLASIIRTRKFIKRGFSINAGQYLKMGFQLSKLDLSNINVLEDQLIGVDVAYFEMLISSLQSHAANEKEAGKEFKIEYSYLATIVDKIFN